jgi:prepilin-type N-terminal cleavage/methylation domain-containing protein
MSKLAFTLIELIIVILIIGIVSFLVVRLPSFATSAVKIEELREYLYPNGEFYLLEDGEEIVKDKNLTLNIKFFAPEIYKYDGKEFKKVDFGYLKDKRIIFKYKVKNGIGDSFILKNGDTYYVFKPFYIKKVDSFERAKEDFLLIRYMPKEGEFY